MLLGTGAAIIIFVSFSGQFVSLSFLCGTATLLLPLYLMKFKINFNLSETHTYAKRLSSDSKSAISTCTSKKGREGERNLTQQRIMRLELRRHRALVVTERRERGREKQTSSHGSTSIGIELRYLSVNATMPHQFRNVKKAMPRSSLMSSMSRISSMVLEIASMGKPSTSIKASFKRCTLIVHSLTSTNGIGLLESSLGVSNRFDRVSSAATSISCECWFNDCAADSHKYLLKTKRYNCLRWLDIQTCRLRYVNGVNIAKSLVFIGTLKRADERVYFRGIVNHFSLSTVPSTPSVSLKARNAGLSASIWSFGIVRKASFRARFIWNRAIENKRREIRHPIACGRVLRFITNRSNAFSTMSMLSPRRNSLSASSVMNDDCKYLPSFGWSPMLFEWLVAAAVCAGTSEGRALWFGESGPSVPINVSGSWLMWNVLLVAIFDFRFFLPRRFVPSASSSTSFPSFRSCIQTTVDVAAAFASNSCAFFCSAERFLAASCSHNRIFFMDVGLGDGACVVTFVVGFCAVVVEGGTESSDDAFQKSVSWLWLRRKSNIICFRSPIQLLLIGSGVKHRRVWSTNCEPPLHLVRWLATVGAGVRGRESEPVKRW